MNWLFAPRKDFFKMLAAQTAKAEEVLYLLVQFLVAPTEESALKIDTVEQEADELRRIVVDELNRTFVTPIDREDIFILSRAIDDIIDYANTSAEEMILFGIEPDANIRKMVDKLFDSVKEINLAVLSLNKHPGVCSEHLVRARKMENSIERYYREGLVELFKTKDVIRILKTREVYRHLSNAADRVAETADVIGDILVKTT